VTEAKSSKRSRRAERREQGSVPEPGRRHAPSDPGPDSEASGSARESTATQVIRDRNLRLREQAAAQRRSKRERERRTAAASGLDAGERVDDALARSTHAVTVWLKKNSNTVQWVIVLLIVAGISWQIYSWRSKKTKEREADALAKGLGAELGQVKNELLEDEESKEYPSVLPSFPDDAARLNAAAKDYKAAIALAPNSGPGRLAELGLASVLFQQDKFDDALARYRAVAAGPLAKTDTDIRGRALEGMGLSLESKKDLDGALQQFGRLANLDEPGLKTLGLYHEARIYYLKGNKEKAKERLGKAQEQLKKLAKFEGGPPSYLGSALRELGTALDPASAAGVSAEETESLRRQLMNDPGKLQRLLDQIKRGALPNRAPEPPESEPAPGGPSAPSSAPTPAETTPPSAPSPARGKAAMPKSGAKGQGSTAPKPGAPSRPAPAAPAQPTGSESGQP
jgi:tetratricopeptide (TPR) repeat protein